MKPSVRIFSGVMIAIVIVQILATQSRKSLGAWKDRVWHKKVHQTNEMIKQLVKDINE